MEPRLDLHSNTAATRFAKYLVSANKALTDSALPAATQELVKVRASQINGCAACTDMHTKDAAHYGERDSTCSRSGGRQPSSRTPSGPHSSWLSRARGSPMHRERSATTCGATPKSTTTRT